MLSKPITQGVFCALAAGIVWGLVFVAPQILSDYPPEMLAFGRYLAFGLICLPLAWHDRQHLAGLERKDWLAALELSVIGNILYYLSLAAAIQLAGGSLPTLIIGTLPVVIAIVSNTGRKTLPWRRLLPSLLIILAGIALVHLHEQGSAPAGAHYAQGVLLAFAALACWTWYPIRNARWLRLSQGLASGTWATAQGLMTLPLSLLGMVAMAVLPGPSGFSFPLGPRPAAYLSLMLAIGLLASWLGTLLWNRASQLLPATLLGQLIVFETLAALAYGILWQGRLPDLASAIGALLLLGGVLAGIRSMASHKGETP